MIRNSFVLLDRIGLKKERQIWSSGIEDWHGFINSGRVKSISAASKQYYDRQLIRAGRELAGFNSSYFTKRLPLSEHWRLYDYFSDDAVFLDIEASPGHGISVVGLFDGISTRTMVKGINLDFAALSKELAKYKIIVTFNGSSFDVPFLKRFMPFPDVPHFDLRFACRRIGLNGGLKSIERELGISRSSRIVSSLSGGDAAELWRHFMASGDRYYLDLLVEYNEEDTISLKRIAGHCYGRLRSKALLPLLEVGRIPAF